MTCRAIYFVFLLPCYIGLEDRFPPTHPIDSFYDLHDGKRIFPTGLEVKYVSKKYADGYVIDARPSCSEEARERERLKYDVYNSIRKAAEVHRRVRKYARDHLIRPGVRLFDLCEQLENATRVYLESDKSAFAGLKAGVGFPTGCSINHVAAHYTPNPGDNTVLKYGDVMKLDFGTHVNGLIVDSAFTWAADPQFRPLLAAVREATLAGIREAGIDARLKDVGAVIQEVMESYEVTIRGRTYPVKTVRNLCGHSIQPFIIHGGKTVPVTRGERTNVRMEEGEVFAIETFGSTGRGLIEEQGECSHFALKPSFTGNPRDPRARDLVTLIRKNFGTLPWCKRYLERAGARGQSDSYGTPLQQLVQSGIILDYPPLWRIARKINNDLGSDVKGSYVAQYEHTIILRPTCKEVVSHGDDW